MFTTLQLYIHHKQASTIRRIKELKAFKKVFVKQNKEKQVTIILPKKELYIYNEEMKLVLENSEVELYLQDMGLEIFKTDIKIK